MIGFGIVGCGSIASTHLAAIQSIPGAKLIACCDINFEKGNKFAEENHCQFYQDYKKLIEDSRIKVVTIATPHYLHKSMSIYALNRNKNVISEKPMATTVADAEEILEAAKKSEGKYAVSFQNRFNDSFIEAKRLVESGRFGRLKGIKAVLTWSRDDAYYNSTDWKGTKDKEGGGVLINQAIHSIDAITWLIGQPEKIKSTVMTSLLDDTIEVEDAAIVSGIMKHGARMIIMASNDYSDNPDPVITLNFQKSTLSLSMSKLLVDDVNVLTVEKNSSNSYKSYWGDGHKRLFKAFTDDMEGIKNQYTNILACEDAIQSLRVVQAAYESSETDYWINLSDRF